MDLADALLCSTLLCRGLWGPLLQSGDFQAETVKTVSKCIEHFKFTGERLDLFAVTFLA